MAFPKIDYVAGYLTADVSLQASLPGSGIPQNAELRLHERWVRPYHDQPWRLFEYVYELLDHERNVRRALHLHDRDVFVATYRVVVHEHCESPIGTARCDHFAGSPVKDGFAALDRLMEIWIDDRVPTCDALKCL